MEVIIHSLLLALHNIALVGCAAAPFYNRNLVNTRAQYGAKLFYELDKVVEDTLQGNAPYCIFFITTLFVTGFGFPFNHYFFYGTFKEISNVTMTSGIIKLTFVFGMLFIMLNIFFKINPELKRMFNGFSKDKLPALEVEGKFFKLRKKRKQLCEICLVFAIIVLISSAFLGFNMN